MTAKSSRNPVYESLRTEVKCASQSFHDEAADPERRKQLLSLNAGVRCYMNDQQLLKEVSLTEVVADAPKYEKPMVIEQPTYHDIMDEVSEDCLVALYSPQPKVHGLVWGGIPSTVTQVALRSTLMWQLHASALRLGESRNWCELYSKAIFFFPNVQMNPDEKQCQFNVSIMSSVESAVDHAVGVTDADVNQHPLIRRKIETPLMAALMQNRWHRKHGTGREITRVVLDDIGVDWNEVGMASVVANVLFGHDQHPGVMATYGPCFESLTLYGPPAATMHIERRQREWLRQRGL